ncbi:ABC transporter ATP-binding protein/permease [Patescibacteria group bacterium]|nr:ABC transporter ATP-binding protein/permease [Patescibacteria group bacterium]
MHLFLKGKLDILEKVSSLFDQREKVQFAGVMAVALAAALFQALGVVSVLPFLELVIEPDIVYQNRWLNLAFTSLGFETAFSFTMAAGFVMLGILVAGNLISAAAAWLKIRFVWQKNHSISVALLQTYLSLPYVYFLNKHSADLGKTILSEVQQLTNQLLMPILHIITNGIIVVIVLALLFFVNPVVAAGATFLFGSAYILVFLFLRSTLKTRGEIRLQENTGRFTTAGEALAGVKDIKALGRERYFFERFSKHSSRFSALQAWSGVAIQLPRYFMEMVAFGGVIALILVFLALRQDGTQVIPLISFFAFAGYRLIPALQYVFQAVSEIQFNRPILDKIAEDMKGGVGQSSFAGSGELPTPLFLREQIKLESVSFHYPYTSQPALQAVSLEVPKGAVVGFVGPTGGGKTTLVDIIIGLLVPQEGAVKVDGVEVNHENVRNWQRNLGYVPQQIFLGDDTVMRNVAFGLPDEKIDMAQIELVCQIANLHDFIARELPQGYDTVIGERGVRLSGGQRQRIGIARALYHNPEVLVLDEATNSLDGATENAVLEAMKSVTQFNKTLIVVAHRLTTVRDCDIIYLVDKGKIAARGTYKELLESNPQFRAMAREPEHL